MRVLAACSLGGAGHLHPLLPFLNGARRRGHETLVVGPPALADMVNEARHPFAAGGEPPESAIAPIRERLPVLSAAEASVLGNRELFGRLATAAMLPAMERVLVEWRPDIVVRDPCEYASAVIANQMGVVAVQVAIGLAVVEWGSIDVAAPALEDHRPGLTNELRHSPYVSRFPASLDPSPFPVTYRFREPDERGTRKPLPDWWEGSRAPLVYVTFGTVLGHMSIATEAFRAAILAVAGIDARVLVTVGRTFDASQLGPIPGNVHVEPWVDQADVLAEAQIVVCHGGSGTTFGSLRAGVPLVIVPLFADQFVNGAKVAAAGAGLMIDTGADRDLGRRPLAETDAPRITDAIKTVRNDPSYRAHAQRVAAEMAGSPTVDSLLDEVFT
jgi:UDP:flavonoid glycosyltransferase YjiC (YdhE family)